MAAADTIVIDVMKKKRRSRNVSTIKPFIKSNYQSDNKINNNKNIARARSWEETKNEYYVCRKEWLRLIIKIKRASSTTQKIFIDCPLQAQ